MAVTLGLTGVEVGAGTGDPVPAVPEGPVRLELLLPLTDTWGQGRQPEYPPTAALHMTPAAEAAPALPPKRPMPAL